jgi:hypothetical protein
VSHNSLSESLSQLNILAVWKLSRIGSRIAELLSLPNGGHHEDAIRAQAFEDYVQDYVDSWFTWAQRNRLGVERVEDLILVSGCTVLWSPHGLPLRSRTTPWTRKSLWRADRSITAGRVLFGPTFGDAYYIIIVVSNQSVPQTTFSWHALMFFLVPRRAEFHHDSGSMCLHQGLSSKVRPLPGSGQFELKQIPFW